MLASRPTTNTRCRYPRLRQEQRPARSETHQGCRSRISFIRHLQLLSVTILESHARLFSLTPELLHLPYPTLTSPSSLSHADHWLQFWYAIRSFPSASRPTDLMVGRVTFRNSPFYTILKPLSNVVELKQREQTRDTARLTINLDDATAAKFQSDSSCRAMVFCATETFDSTWKPVDIAFPHHAELRCNQDELKVNLKGLKNKPGSTRPVDITPFLRKKAGFPNNIELVYALTNKVCRLLFLCFSPRVCFRSHLCVLHAYRVPNNRSIFFSSIWCRRNLSILSSTT